MEFLAIVLGVSLVVAIHAFALRVGRRWGIRVNDPATGAEQLRRAVWFSVLAASGVVAVMVWGNTGDRSMNHLVWARYGIFLVIFIALGVWALARTRSR